MAFSFIYDRSRDLSQQLRWAISRGDLHLVYQPIVNLNTRRIVGAEVLARWNDEEGNPVSPDVFIKIAEEQGYVGVSRFRKFGQRDKWKGCSLTAIKMAETRSNDDTTSTAESHSNLQSEGGPCRAEGG
jgi:predicted signal transduction protein with EAL and GGDEF domain